MPGQLLKLVVWPPFPDKVETNVGLGSICECFEIFLRNKMDCSGHSFVPPHLHCFAADWGRLEVGLLSGGACGGNH